jgi:magnesium-transporting ATPase (P-type)
MPGNVEIAYNAQSPDEEALTKAARQVNFQVMSRVSRTLTVKVLGRVVAFEILAVACLIIIYISIFSSRSVSLAVCSFIST